MIKSFGKFNKDESTKPLADQMHSHAKSVYNDVAPDLPRYGRGDQHVVSAIDVLRDRLSDKFSKHPDYKHGMADVAAKKAVHGYTGTAAEEEKEFKQYSREQKRKAPKPVKAPKEKPAPKKKPRKGIGSY